MKSFAVSIGALMGRIVRALDQTFCRHEYCRMFSPGRSRLKCAKCGKVTRGWDTTSETRPILKYPGDPNRYGRKS